MSMGSYELSSRPPALAHRMAQWSGARPNWRAAGGSNRGSGIRFFRTASPHTPYISAFWGRPPRPQAPNLSIFWTGLPAGTPKIYPHRWTAFVRIFRGPAGPLSSPSPPDFHAEFTQNNLLSQLSWLVVKRRACHRHADA